MNCPCCSGKEFASCCEPIIKNESAPTALSLMRSRYTAYTMGNADYLRKTAHVEIRDQFTDNEIANWLKENSWTKLTIVSVEHGSLSDSRGIVEFKASYTNSSNSESVLHERSTFLKENNKWYYASGVINPPKVDLMKKVGRNDPCPCGSGLKQKRCCGKM